MQIEGKIKSVVFFNDENAYSVIRVRGEQGEFTAVGVFPDCLTIGPQKVAGLEVLMDGDWTNHKRYGRQFSFSAIQVKRTGLLFFLTNVVKGIGEKLARELIEHYGEEELVNIIENDPEKLTEFKGIKQKRMAQIVESWKKYRALRILSDFFAEKGVEVTSNLLLRIYRHFKHQRKDPVKAIEENPYSLTEIKGIGFKTADKLALQLGVDEYSPLRINALVDFILSSEANGNGHTYLTLEQVYEKAAEYIYNESGRLKEDELQRLILEAAKSGRYVFFEESEIVALKSYYYKEGFIRDFIEKRLTYRTSYRFPEDNAKKFIAEQERLLGFKLSPEQYKAVFDLITGGYPVFILCGYAGTGKSTISKVILNFFMQFIPPYEITTCAFTGMASKRIRELTGFQSSTIHSLLGYSGKGFKHNEHNPLDYEVILLDEASMVNVDIFYSLVRAIPEDAVFIMVGDDAQLPPIGAGNVFCDLLQREDVPKAKLTEIHRQARDSVLTYFAGHIRQGRVPDKYCGAYKDWEFHKMDVANWFSLKKKLSDAELKEVREKHYQTMLEKMLEKIFETIKKYGLSGLDRIWDVQVIAPMKNSLLGTKNLNDVLQGKLNDMDGKQVKIRGRLLKQYDKVIHLKNQNMKCIMLEDFQPGHRWDEDDEYTSRIYNGALGIVYDIDEEWEEFYVLYPADSHIVIYSFDDFGDIIDLGYALTIHKVQGSQFRFVFMPVINSFYIMLNTKLAYTAITRAIEKIFIFAQDYAFKVACKNIQEAERQTFLKLWEEKKQETGEKENISGVKMESDVRIADNRLF